jgi:hypothetical protein
MFLFLEKIFGLLEILKAGRPLEVEITELVTAYQYIIETLEFAAKPFVSRLFGAQPIPTLKEAEKVCNHYRGTIFI